MKNVIAVAKKGEENKKLLSIKDVDKTVIIKITKMSNIINL